MKKAIKMAAIAALTALMALALCACGTGASSSSSSSSASSASQTSSSTQASSSSSSSAATPVDAGDTLVAYFSATGNTAPLAKYTAEALGADLYEIRAEEYYTEEDLDYNDSNSRTTIEQKDKSVRPRIDGTQLDLEKYDTVVLAYPIWWGEEPRIMDSFVESVDLGGKNVVAFCTSASSGIGSSDKNLAALADPTANWLEGHRFAAGASAEDVESWLEDIGLL